MNKSTRGISHCKRIHLLHLCLGGAARPHHFSLATLDRNLRICLIEGCQWDKSLEEEYVFYAFYLVFLFPSGWGSSVLYRIDVQIGKASLCLTPIKSHWAPYILSFEKNPWNYSVGNAAKAHLRSMKAVSVLSGLPNPTQAIYFLAPFCLPFANYKCIFPLNYWKVQTLLCSPDLYIFLN